jgi:uncharacterized protein (TIGR02145 family)
LKFFTDKAQEIAVKVLPQSDFDVVQQSVVIRRLGGFDNYRKECEESSCIVQLGRKAMVDYVAQCSFTKLSGSDFTVSFELYDVSTEGLIDKFVDKAKNADGLLAIMQKKIPDGFRKIPGAVPEAKTAPPPIDDEVKGGVLTDSRDGKKYRTVKIGSQIWMAENLNYAASGSRCYDNKPENCKKYGRLYNWTTAMTLPFSCEETTCSNRIQTKHRGVCTSGWHLPSHAEWGVLMATVDGEEAAGKKLKAKSGWNKYKGKSGNGTDEFGFFFFSGGSGSSDGSFYSVGYRGLWWSASEDISYYAYRRDMNYDNDYAYWDNSHKSGLFSVRCVQD